jgi:hypothetical protein
MLDPRAVVTAEDLQLELLKKVEVIGKEDASPQGFPTAFEQRCSPI